MRCLGGLELGAQVAGRAVGVAALAGLAGDMLANSQKCRWDRWDTPELELCVCWEQALVVGWATEGFFAAGLGMLAVD